LVGVFVSCGTPGYILSDKNPGFFSKKIRHWFKTGDVETLNIEPRSPWETNPLIYLRAIYGMNY